MPPLLLGALLLAFPLPAPHVTLSPPPAPLTAGRAWGSSLRVVPASAGRPAVLAEQGSRQTRAAVRPAGRGRFAVRLTLPLPGRWHVVAVVGGRRLPLLDVSVRPSLAPA